MVFEGWNKGVIEDIAKVTSGGTPSRQKDSYWNGHIPWVTTSEVKFGVITDTEQKITEDGLKNSSAKLFPKDTILMAMYGQGKTRGQVAKLGIEASTNQACAALLLKDGFEVNYYYQYLMSQYENIRELANSGGQQNLSAGIIKAIKVPLPPLLEQRKIALILSTWDKAIATMEKLIESSKQQKKALMQQLLKGKKRLINPETGVSFEGEWDKVKLSTICTVRRGASPRPIKDEKWFSNEGRGWIRIADVTKQRGRHLLKTSQYLSELGVEKSVSVNPGDLIMSICGTIGVPKFLGIKACVHDGFVVFREVGNCLNLNCLYYHLTFISERLNAAGQPGTQKNLNTSIVGNILYPTISFEEQQKIASVLTAADNEIQILDTKLSYLQQEKKALMQQLLTGKRRVKVEKELEIKN